MFDTVVLGRTCSKEDYKIIAPKMRMQLFEAQRACRQQKIPLLILINGVDGSGRGAVMNFLSEWMDGKYLRSFTFWKESDEERERPLEWRYWQCLPGKGETAVFFDGWYGGAMRKRCSDVITEKDFLARMEEFKGLEQSLALSGMTIVKIWLHLDKKTHDRRLKARRENKIQSSLTKYDEKSAGKYKELVEVAGDAITRTDRTYAPWHIIDAADANFRNLSVARVIVEAVSRALSSRAAGEAALKAGGEVRQQMVAGDPFLAGLMDVTSPTPDAVLGADGAAGKEQACEIGSAIGEMAKREAETGTEASENVLPQNEAGADAGEAAAPADTAGESLLRRAADRGIPLTSLEVIDLSPTIDPDVYKKQLKDLQTELLQLTYHAYRHGISSTILFEGMDAAGKGGAIRRLLSGVDCRIARVIPISSPTDEELAHHYLWRFWRHIPRFGHVTVYDRSWYGRVLVERVENLTPQADWSRAYEEINHFEHSLTKGGNIVLKFWLHISSEEELRRFREREETPWKRYKITDEDWRNRAKWDQYLVAADEMFQRTSTSYAPWNIVPAEDKKYARIEVLTRFRDELKKQLEKRH
ncbi:MAG: polyphosphate:AMP phosphotransferase [Desulfovibrionaceae bacterium]|nr:polyphosphate:AMP phosphotransferase [Desulfovibrionaceae bacterium]